jgi:hypothetical protein
MVLPQQFWDKVIKTDTCWYWVGPTSKGYGTFIVNRVHKRAHKLSLEDSLGRELDEGSVARHKCKNIVCVNPAHLDESVFIAGVDDPMMGRISHKSKLTPKEVLEIRASDETYRVLSVKYGINISGIGKIKNRELWKWV